MTTDTDNPKPDEIIVQPTHAERLFLEDHWNDGSLPESQEAASKFLLNNNKISDFTVVLLRG